MALSQNGSLRLCNNNVFFFVLFQENEREPSEAKVDLMNKNHQFVWDREPERKRPTTKTRHEVQSGQFASNNAPANINREPSHFYGITEKFISNRKSKCQGNSHNQLLYRVISSL